MSGFFDFLSSDASESDQTRSLNNFGSALVAGGQFLSAENRTRYGQEQQAAMDYQAAQLRQQASDAAAAGQRSAWSADLQAKYLASKALAAAGASGAGALDPTVVNVMSRMASEGAYRGAVALYQGQDRERLMNMQAEAKQYEGKLTSSQSRMAGLTEGVAGAASLLRGAARDSSLYQRFAGGGPRLDATPNTVD